jgi:hypothetical protein
MEYLYEGITDMDLTIIDIVLREGPSPHGAPSVPPFRVSFS